MKGLSDMMKQAQQMQEKMQKAQQELESQEVEGKSGAGLVSVILNGRCDAKRVSIDASLMTEDKEVLEDLLAAAINDAVRKVEEAKQKSLSDMTSGIPMPEGFKMPF